MGLKQSLQQAVQAATGLRIMRQPPFGVDVFADLRMVLPALRMRTVVDIGANTGTQALTFLQAWPDAHIHCCEPVPSAFASLRGRLPADRSTCHALAIGAMRGAATMRVPVDPKRSDLSSLQNDKEAPPGVAMREMTVPILPLADLFNEQGIQHAEYVKVDTEGHELAVLDGAEPLLRSGRIGLIELEVGMNATNTTHVSLHRVMERLAPHGYHLFGIYEQMHEWPTRRPVLRRCNAVFIPEALAAPGTWSPFPQ